MWVAIGWLLVFLFPLVMVYLTGGINSEPLLDDVEYQRRKRLAEKKEAEKKRSVETKTIELTSTTKKNKKNNKKKTVTAAKVVEPVVEQIEKKEEPKKKEEPTTKKKNKKNKKASSPVVEEPKATKPKEVTKSKEETKVTEPKQDRVTEQPKKEENKVEESVKEIDEHMDPTANYARVMRIRPEESEDEWEAVPYEEGWSQVKSRRPYNPTKSNIDVNAEINNVGPVVNAHLDKKQRENSSRSEKKKQSKAEANRLQEERLKKHQKELEKIKIQEFYSTGKGKNTPWGKNGQRSSSKVPQSVASINEFGQLIWD